MNFRRQAYLQEMGIQSWSLYRPQAVSGIPQPAYDIDPECRLLLISPELPEGPSAILFEKVLKSFSVSIRMSRHMYPHHLHQLGKHALDWVWFAGCEAVGGIAQKQLVSPLLSQIEGHPQHRRELWRQICTYQESSK